MRNATQDVSVDTFTFEHDAYADDGYGDAWEDDALEGDYIVNPNKLDVESIIALTARLAQLLAQEADMLTEMRVRDIEKLQKEKLLLVDALEAQKRHVERNPYLLNTISDSEALEMAQIIEIFHKIMTENHHRLLIAKEVNQKVVEAIADVVNEAAGSGFYDKHGKTESSPRPVSVSLNKTI
jgi:flagellar biosynthesis/type III secretory pathway chaperone